MKKVKDKSISQPVRCSFCKTEKTADKVQGGQYGGRSVCDKCFAELKEQEPKDRGYDSLGEEQAYGMYGV